MIKEKKIIFCIDSLEKGGAQRVISVLSNEFCKENEVYIITLFKVDIEYNFDDRIKVIQMDSNKKNIFSYIRKIKYMKKVINDIKPDIIISFLIKSSMFSSLGKGRYKLIISDRNDPKEEYKRKLHFFCMKNTYKKANGFVFQTEDAKRYFERIFDFSKYYNEIIFNPVDSKFENNVSSRERKNIIVSIGRLTAQKNFKLLIDSFYKIKDEIPQYNLKIYGKGELHDELERYIEYKGLKERVTLQGVSNNIQNVLLESKIYVLSSDYEGMPNTLVEAMTIGTPVIATDCPCGGPRMLIKNGENGLLVPVNESDALSRAILKLSQDEKMMEKFSVEGKKIIEYVRKDVIVEKWSNFIQTIINDGENK